VTTDKKRFGLAPDLKVAPGLQKRMPEASKRHLVLGQQQAGHALAADHIVFPRL
jgi:hypothetical protein